MPPRTAESCSCSVVSGCWVVKHTETTESSTFTRVWVRGPHAKSVLEDILHAEAPQFHQQYHPLTDSGLTWPTRGGWCALLCGRELKLAREQVAWSLEDIDRLRVAYHAGGMPLCQAEFAERTYSALTCALRRYNIRSERRRAEAISA